MEPFETRRLKAPGDANARLKRLIADATLDKPALKVEPLFAIGPGIMARAVRKMTTKRAGGGHVP